jgi:hypothetical protein
VREQRGRRGIDTDTHATLQPDFLRKGRSCQKHQDKQDGEKRATLSFAIAPGIRYPTKIAQSTATLNITLSGVKAIVSLLLLLELSTKLCKQEKEV